MMGKRALAWVLAAILVFGVIAAVHLSASLRQAARRAARKVDPEHCEALVTDYAVAARACFQGYSDDDALALEARERQRNAAEAWRGCVLWMKTDECQPPHRCRCSSDGSFSWSVQ